MIATKRVSEDLTELRIKTNYGTTQGFLNISDVHFDSKYCDRKLLRKHLDIAIEKGFKVIINGDLFDVMGCYKDPRSKAQDIRKEYLGNRPYLDLIVEDAYNFFKPYAKALTLLNYGNHETSIIKHRDTDILERLHFLLSQHNPDIQLGGYDHFYKVKFEHASGGAIKSKLFYLHHGMGGNAMRSKGILQNQIRGFIYPDADILSFGHTHQKHHDPSNVRIRVSQNGQTYTDAQHVLWTGSYKDTSTKRFGFEKEKAFLPTKSGGWFIEMTYKKEGIKMKVYEAD